MTKKSDKKKKDKMKEKLTKVNKENIKKKKNVRPLLPSKVWEYIDHNNLYKK